jgi:hypothetical protein
VIEKLTTGSRAHSKGEFKLEDKTWSFDSHYQYLSHRGDLTKHDKKGEFENQDYIRIELSKKDEKLSNENLKSLDSVTFNCFYQVIRDGLGDQYYYSISAGSGDSNPQGILLTKNK